MNRNAIGILGVLAAAVVGLSIALAVAMSDGHSDGHSDGMGYAGMMGAFGQMDSDEMLARMKEVLGEDAYQRMLAHVQAHRDGKATTDPTIDGMMHQMMDGMMGQMPMDSHGMMGGGS